MHAQCDFSFVSWLKDQGYQLGVASCSLRFASQHCNIRLQLFPILCTSSLSYIPTMECDTSKLFWSYCIMSSFLSNVKIRAINHDNTLLILA